MRNVEAVGELTRRLESDYIRGNTNISKYVTHSLYETISRIEAYLNSKHISGETDSQGRPKPFFNIVVAAANIWFRATDIDRRHIKLFSKFRKGWVNSFFANIILQDWMKRENFGQFLNEWGRTMSRYNSALVKFVKNSDGLHISVVPWNRVIVDSVDIDAGPIIEILELSESQLRKRVKTHNYDKEQVDKLISTKRTRETTDKRRKDNKADYFKLYEVHDELPLSHITEQESDDDEFAQQMHVISFVGGRKDGKKEYDDFTLYKGREADPYMLTELLKEDGRTLAIGPVEYLFDDQWMQNHAMKSIKDQLDIASKLLLQTPDAQFLGRNVLTQLEQGDIMIHAPNMPLTQVHNASHDIVSWQNYAVQWRDLGRELVNTSEAMMGAQPKSGTAWRLQETVLNESYSLFEVFMENKGLYVEQMLRERILPYLFEKYDNDDEISALLEKHDLEQIDQLFIKNEAKRRVKERVFGVLEEMAKGEEIEPVGPMDQEAMIQREEMELQEQLRELGNQRFVKPDEVSWKKQFEGVEYDIEIEVTPEMHNIQEMLTTLNTALKIVTTPGFDQNPRAQAVVGKIFELTGAMSPTEFYAIPSTPVTGGSTGGDVQLSETQPNAR